MREIDADFLEELRAAANEVRSDLEARQQMMADDPVAAHDQIMAATRVVTKDATTLIYKRRDPPQVYSDGDSFEGYLPDRHNFLHIESTGCYSCLDRRNLATAQCVN